MAIAPVLISGRWYTAPGTAPVAFSVAEATLFGDLLLADGEALVLRPLTPNASDSRVAAYGVVDGRYRVLPIAVVRTVDDGAA